MSALLRWLRLHAERIGLRIQRAGLEHAFNEFDEDRSPEVAAINARIEAIDRELAS